MKGRVKPETSIKYTHVFTCPHMYTNEDVCTWKDTIKLLLYARPAGVLTVRKPAPNSRYGRSSVKVPLGHMSILETKYNESAVE